MHIEMFHYQTKFAIVLTLLMFYSTRASKNINNCKNSCGELSLPYPFGFSDGCAIKLSCSNSKVQIGPLQVQNVTSDSIFISLPAKCNRNRDFIKPLFGNNYAPTWNNSFLVQNCSSQLGGCNIPTASFIGSQIEVEGCDKRSDNISCFTKREQTQLQSDVLTPNDWNGIKCSSLFSAIAFDKSKELSLQFQVAELGWWLQGPCNCFHHETCTEVKLGGNQKGFRCHCPEGFSGDGFMNGTGCQREKVSSCNGSVLKFGRCWKAIKIGVLVGAQATRRCRYFVLFGAVPGNPGLGASYGFVLPPLGGKTRLYIASSLACYISDKK